jgi:hypothetical protein
MDARGSFSTGELGISGRSRNGIISSRNLYWSRYFYRTLRNFYRNSLVIYIPFNIIYPPSI